MQHDQEMVDWAYELIYRHVSRNRGVSRDDNQPQGGHRWMAYRSRMPNRKGEHVLNIGLKIDAWTNPFQLPEYAYVLEDDAPIDEQTSDPILTEFLRRHPMLFCFWIETTPIDIYRAVITRSPEEITAVVDEMEGEANRQFQDADAAGQYD